MSTGSDDFPYVEHSQIGRGGMSTVTRAAKRGDREEVALKRPIPWPGSHNNERLKREISVLAELDHPNVIRLLDHGVNQTGMYWYTMPIGKKAEGRLGIRPLGHQRRATMCDGARRHRRRPRSHARRRVLHRDVKPANVLLVAGGTWVIADCGLVRRPIGETTAEYTGSASVMGTFGFIAPEAHGDPHGVSPAADVYSWVGCSRGCLPVVHRF